MSIDVIVDGRKVGVVRSSAVPKHVNLDGSIYTNAGSSMRFDNGQVTWRAEYFLAVSPIPVVEVCGC